MIQIHEPAVVDTSGPLSARASALVVADQATLDEAGAILREAAALRRSVVEAFEPSKKAAHAAHRELCALEARLLAPLDAVRSVVEPKVVAYQREEQRRREEVARAEADAARRAEEDRRLAEATDAAAAGDSDLADAILDEPAPVVAPLAVAAPTTAGVTTRTTWTAQVVDLAALVKYVAAHPEWATLLTVNTAALNALARTQRDRLAIPGVRAVASQSVAVR